MVLDHRAEILSSQLTYFLKYIFNFCFIYVQLINFHVLNPEDNRKLYLDGLTLTWFTPESREKTKQNIAVITQR